MVELMAYSVKLKKMVTIKAPELVILKNGRKAVRGVAAEDPSAKVVKFLSDQQAEEICLQLADQYLAEGGQGSPSSEAQREGS